MEDTLALVSADPKNGDVTDIRKNHQLKGKKIRDEFICPITYELMREPVVASDGHTYEKSAIEKWLKSHQNSPRNGEPITTNTILNINLKKLIQDIINEGGAGFYMDDLTNKDRLFEVRAEKVLVLYCLGPPESEWNEQSFQVNRYGCIGGRKLSNEEASLKDMILFKDITVSRKHFEINQTIQLNGMKSFFIRDLGSAGGTFIRIPYGKKKQLHPGMIVLLGKHQFTVSSIDDLKNYILSSSASKQILERFDNNQSKQLQLPQMGHSGTSNKYQQFKQDVNEVILNNEELEISSKLKKLSIENAEVDDLDGTSEILELSIEQNQKYSTRRCTITCCAPDGSPLQGQSFIIDRKGADMGRKVTNSIPLLIKTRLESGEEKIINVDTAISSEHARVEFEESTGKFFISDGTITKPSTNGTWYRLSGPHQESPPHILQQGVEVLIGTVRFEVKESMTIEEEGVDSKSLAYSASSNICK